MLAWGDWRGLYVTPTAMTPETCCSEACTQFWSAVDSAGWLKGWPLLVPECPRVIRDFGFCKGAKYFPDQKSICALGFASHTKSRNRVFFSFLSHFLCEVLCKFYFTFLLQLLMPINCKMNEIHCEHTHMEHTVKKFLTELCAFWCFL